MHQSPPTVCPLYENRPSQDSLRLTFFFVSRQALPHFNFRTDVLSALVPHLGRVDSRSAPTVALSIQNAIKADRSGDLTLEALQMTAQLVKQGKCTTSPYALAPFLEIRFDEGALALEQKKKQDILSRKQTKKAKAEEREMIRKGRAAKEKKKAEKERLKSFGHVDDASDASEDEGTVLGIYQIQRLFGPITLPCLLVHITKD